MASKSDPWNAAVDQGVLLDVPQFPSALLMRVAMVIRHNGTLVYAKRHGLTGPEWRILGHMHWFSPIRLSVLRRVANFDKAQASRVLHAMEKRGLVRRFPSEDHSYHQNIEITAEGRALADRVFPEAYAEQLRLLRLLTPEERRITYNVIQKLLGAYGVGLPIHEMASEETVD